MEGLMRRKRSSQEGGEALFRAWFEHSAEALFVLDPAGRIVDLNGRASESLLRARDELVGNSPCLFDARWREQFPDGIAAVLEAGAPVAFPSSHRRADGTQFPVQVRVAACGPEGPAFALCFARDVGEAERGARALRECEERFRTLVQLSFDVYWETDAHHRFTRQEFSERLPDAPTRAAEIGRTRWEVPYLEPDEAAWRGHRALLDAHLPFRDFELARPTPDGGRRHVSVSGFPVFDDSGRFAGYRGVGRHTTERKRVEAEHRTHLWMLESMDTINRALQGTQDPEAMAGEVLQAVLGIFDCDRAWLLHPCDAQAARWRTVAQRTRPGIAPAFEAGTEVAMEAGMAALFAAAQATQDPVLPSAGALAERFAAPSQVAIAVRPKGEPAFLFGLQQCGAAHAWTPDEHRLLREIGARLADALSTLLALRRLRESERRSEAAQRVARVGWWERDFVTGRVSLSDESCRIFGVQPLDLPHWHGRWLSLIHPDDRARAAAASETALAGGPRYDLEYRVIRPDGAVRVVHSQGDVARDESGRPTRQFGVMQDVTELRHAEQELRASEARFRTFVDRATDAFFLLDEQLAVVDVNRQACESLGHAREQLVGMHPRDFDAALDARAIAELARRAGGGETITFETLHRRRDGSVFPVEIRTGTFQQGDAVFYLALARDISERKRADEAIRAKDVALDAARAELARVSRVMTMGELTASIAHEVNQPLAAMVANAAACARWLAADPPDLAKAGRTLESIAADARRASEVIRRIRALVQRQAPHMAAVAVNDAVLDVIALTQQELRANRIVLATMLAEGLPAVAGDRIQLQQVLLNLIVNAVEAMAGVGDRSRELRIASRRDGASAILVEVGDSGPGLGPEHADRLFEAFYTTKPTGIGIGLSISRSIVEAHGGRLWVEPNVPHGAVFRLSLPVAEATP
jgi:PAS domain S-box-containing protein